MVFIFGGAYQGKTDFAREAFSLAEGDIFSCSGTEIDFSRRCVDHIENFTLACTRAGIDPVEYFRAHRGEWEQCVLIWDMELVQNSRIPILLWKRFRIKMQPFLNDMMI